MPVLDAVNPGLRRDGGIRTICRGCGDRGMDVELIEECDVHVRQGRG